MGDGLAGTGDEDLNRMSKEAEYRRHAATLFELATTRAGRSGDNFRLLVMAEAWLKLADKIACLRQRERTPIHPLVRRIFDGQDQPGAD